jgi:hypothetical protein
LISLAGRIFPPSTVPHLDVADLFGLDVVGTRFEDGEIGGLPGSDAADLVLDPREKAASAVIIRSA